MGAPFRRKIRRIFSVLLTNIHIREDWLFKAAKSWVGL